MQKLLKRVRVLCKDETVQGSKGVKRCGYERLDQLTHHTNTRIVKQVCHVK